MRRMRARSTLLRPMSKRLPPHLQPQQPERQLQPDDFLVVRIERHDVQRLAAAACRRGDRCWRAGSCRVRRARSAASASRSAGGRTGNLGRGARRWSTRMSTCDLTNHKPAAAMTITPRMPQTTIPTTTQTQVFTLPAMSPSATSDRFFASSTQIGSLLLPHTATAVAASRCAPARSPCCSASRASSRCVRPCDPAGRVGRQRRPAGPRAPRPCCRSMTRAAPRL